MAWKVRDNAAASSFSFDNIKRATRQVRFNILSLMQLFCISSLSETENKKDNNKTRLASQKQNLVLENVEYFLYFWFVSNWKQFVLLQKLFVQFCARSSRSFV